jgi:hypothetical protein
MAVGELEGAKFRIEPLRRTGEDAETMRARLTCTCTTSSPSTIYISEGGGGLRERLLLLLITPYTQTTPC